MSTQQVTNRQLKTPGGGGSSTLSVVTKTSSYGMTSADDVVLMDATTGNLQVVPIAASAATKMITIKKIDATLNQVIIIPFVGLIEGANNAILTRQGESVDIISNGTNYYIK